MWKFHVVGLTIHLIAHNRAGMIQTTGEVRAVLRIMSPVKIPASHLIEISVPHSEHHQPLVLEKVLVPLASSEAIWIFMDTGKCSVPR